MPRSGGQTRAGALSVCSRRVAGELAQAYRLVYFAGGKGGERVMVMLRPVEVCDTPPLGAGISGTEWLPLKT